jgi:hypothetical protein
MTVSKKKTRKRRPNLARLVARATSEEIASLEGELSKLKKKYGSDERLRQRILTVTRGHPNMSLAAISRETGENVADIEQAISELRDRNFIINVSEGQVERKMVPPRGDIVSHFPSLHKGGVLKVGVLGDTQLGNKHQRLDVLNTAYDDYESQGITSVYHTGNLVDGFNQFINLHELLPEAGPSFERQVAYAAKVYPKKKGITTYFITGECHEGWWIKKHGWNVGQTIMDRFRIPLACTIEGSFRQQECPHIKDGWCRAHGRDDFVYLGHEEADVELRYEGAKKGQGAIARPMHPGGGTAYALSYKTQKISESLQGGEKPHIQWVGHFHKYNVDYHREVYSVQTGCLEDQTLFMRKHHIQAHVGYLIQEFFIAKGGGVRRYKHEWVPFFTKGFYQNFSTW